VISCDGGRIGAAVGRTSRKPRSSPKFLCESEGSDDEQNASRLTKLVRRVLFGEGTILGNFWEGANQSA